MAPNITDLPVELLQKISKYAIAPSVTEPEYPCEASKTDLTTYTSLLRVNRQFNETVTFLYTDADIIDITFFFDNVPDVFDVYRASRNGVRILRDAKFRLAYEIDEVDSSPRQHIPWFLRDIHSFVGELKGFQKRWWHYLTLYDSSRLTRAQRQQGFKRIMQYQRDRLDPMEEVRELRFPSFGSSLSLSNFTWERRVKMSWPEPWARPSTVVYRDSKAVLAGKLSDVVPADESRMGHCDVFARFLAEARMHCLFENKRRLGRAD